MQPACRSSFREANKNEREFLRQVSTLPLDVISAIMFTHTYSSGVRALFLSLCLRGYTAAEALRAIPFSRIHTARRRSTRKLVSRSSLKTGSRFSSVRKDPSLPTCLTSRTADASYRVLFGRQRSSICLTGKMDSLGRASVSLSVPIACN